LELFRLPTNFHINSNKLRAATTLIAFANAWDNPYLALPETKEAAIRRKDIFTPQLECVNILLPKKASDPYYRQRYYQKDSL